VVAVAFLVEIGPGEHEKIIRDISQRNPHLLAVENVAVAVRDRR
jgi:hypothetical protein